ncbi:unnamed protein product [Withania somnifera]
MKYMCGFYVVSAILWSIIKFSSRLFIWILSRVMKASVSFHVGGCNCLRDAAGAVESISISEVRLSIRQSSVKLGAGLISRDPKLHLLICGLKVNKSRKPRKVGRGKWMVVANIARFLSVSLTETVVKTPKAGLEVKEMTLDISNNSGPEPVLSVKFRIFSSFVHLSKSQSWSDQSSMHSGYIPTSAPFSCDEVSLLCEFGHDRLCWHTLSGCIKSETKFLDYHTVHPINLSFFLKGSNMQLAEYFEQYGTLKPFFSLPKVDLKFVHRVEGFMGIQLKGSKTQSIQDVGESTQLHVRIGYSKIHPASPIRCEIGVKLGGTQCNLIITRLQPWLRLHASKKKKMVLREESSTREKSRSPDDKAIMWTTTISAPELTIMVYDLNGLPLCQGCSQSLHVFSNNSSSADAAVQVEIFDFNLNMSDEHQERLKDLFGIEINTSLIHIAKVSLDLGRKDLDSPEDGLNCKKVLSVDFAGMSMFLTYRRLASLIAAAFSFKRFIKSFLFLCSLNISGEVGLGSAVVPDPKWVNYGSQGGSIVVSVLSDGTPRTANIISSDELEKVKYSVNNQHKWSLEEPKSIYQEHLQDRNLGTKVILLDTQNTKFVKRPGGIKEIAMCSLFSATDIAVRWEPDVHIALVELGLQLKLLVHNQKRQHPAKEGDFKDNKQSKDSKESQQLEKQHKKRESVFAVDVEVLNISAEIGDGVDLDVQVQSIFSENAQIGMLLEGIMLKFNDARIFRSSRMQISRIPQPSSSAPNEKPGNGTTWDWVIQALDVQICMAYRLQLRAIDDSVEEMIRALKLDEKPKAKKTSSTKLGRVRLCIKKLTADIEEEPLQGWLDEHYQLWKIGASESAVRLNFLDELISKGQKCESAAEGNDPLDDGKININGEDIDVEDTSAIQKLREKIYKQSFRSYYQACQKLVQEEGSGACNEGFKAGFKLSSARTSLFSISAAELDVILTKIEVGDAGMMELLQKLDPVCRAHSILFSRLYGCNISLHTGSLVVLIRNYTCPLLAANSGCCIGCVIMAQQATPFQPQMQQNVYIGRWRKVRLLRSVTGTTPPMKTYLDLPLHFQKAEISYGVGFEPAFTDLSYAFTVALRRVNLSIRNPNTDPPLPKKEKSLPWWDEMRNYIHGNSTLYTDPYEKSNKLQVETGYMEIQQADGRIYTLAKNFKILLSKARAFSVEVLMEWGCSSGNPLNHYLFARAKEGVPREKWNLLLRPSLPFHDNQSELPSADNQGVSSGTPSGALKPDGESINSPTILVGPHYMAWLIKFWNLNCLPPHKLRTFSRWPRFGVPRVPRSGNLSLDRVMTRFMFRVDSTPTCIKHMPLYDDDPAKGLTITVTKFKFEMYLGRGKKKFTFESLRDPLELVYQGIDLHIPKAFISRGDSLSVAKVVQMAEKDAQSALLDMSTNDKPSNKSGSMDRHQDDGFLLSSEYFTIRRQSPKADPGRLLAWKEAGRRNIETTCVRSEVDNGSESDEKTRSDPSDDDGYNVVIADNCQRIFVYGLKILWTLEIRDAVQSWATGLSKAFEPSKPSPAMQFAQQKLLEENKVINTTEPHKDSQDAGSRSQDDNHKSPPKPAGPSKSLLEPPPSNAIKADAPQSSFTEKLGTAKDSEGEGTRHFMVNVIEPQFNLHSEDANGKFLLAAVSGRVLARSYHSVISIGYEVIEQALGGAGVQVPESQSQMIWKHMELSVMLEQVQAHVAQTDVDPGAGLQWLPKIRRRSPKVKRTGALLERVFMPCDMYFRYTRHKSGTTHLKVQKLKKDLINAKKSREVSSASLRMALQKAAQLRLMEKEKNKSPSCAMRISLQINKVVWSMLVDGKSFGEAEINDMIYDFNRDYEDIGIAKFTIKQFVVRNCLPSAKSDMLLSAWNPPPEWGKKVMVRVDAKQGAPKDGNSPIELLQVEIYPLKIHLTESTYIMMWAYFFPDEEQDIHRRQEVWKVSTTAGAKHAKKGSSVQEAPFSSNHLNKDSPSSSYGDLSQATKNQKANSSVVTPKIRRTSSFDRNWEENVAESVANELLLQMHSSSVSSSKCGPLASIEHLDEANRNKSKESKLIKSGRSSNEEKKVGKANDEKKPRPRRMREFHNIKISQVELQITYKGSRFAVGDMRLLMDTFHRVEFIGTWGRLFSRVRKHIIWGVLKSVTGMQVKKFKVNNQKEASAAGVPNIDLNLSDSDGGSAEQSRTIRDGFVTSVKGLFNSQRKKAKAFVLRTMRGEEDDLHADWSEGEADFSPFARQLTITKTKKLIRRHTKKFRPRGAKGISSQKDSLPSSASVNATFESDSSSETSPYEQ